MSRGGFIAPITLSVMGSYHMLGSSVGNVGVPGWATPGSHLQQAGSCAVQSSYRTLVEASAVLVRVQVQLDGYRHPWSAACL